VLVVDDKMSLMGIFTDGDLRRALMGKGPNVLDLSMSQLMTCSPRYIAPSALALEAMQNMEADQKNAITCLPVLENQKVLGLIKLHDIVQSGI
jgi:arabinose-5-phosphate isomerase